MIMQQKKRLKSQRTIVNGLPIFARVSVDLNHSAAIVMVHGLVVSSRYMLPMAEQLAKDFNVYIPDLPGYGNSGKPGHILDVAELADALADWMEAVGVARATLLGNSMGCQIIAQFALRYPERLEKAIFVGPTMDPQAPKARQQVGRWLLNLLGEPISLYPIVALDYLQMGFRRFVRTFHYAMNDKIEEKLPLIQVPTLVVCGSRDTVVPYRWTKEVTQLLPQSRHVVIQGAAHDVNYNSPEKLADEVRKFMLYPDNFPS